MGSAYRECKSAFGGERSTADCIPSVYKEVIFESKKSSPAITKGPRLSPAPFVGESEAEIWYETLARTRSLGLRPQVHFPERCIRVTPKVAQRLKQRRDARRSATHADHRPIVAITRVTGLGRFDPFVAPAGNARYLRTADGRNRRRADLADRGRGARSWAACRLRSSEAVTPRRTVAVGVASDG